MLDFLGPKELLAEGRFIGRHVRIPPFLFNGPVRSFPHRAFTQQSENEAKSGSRQTISTTRANARHPAGRPFERRRAEAPTRSDSSPRPQMSS
jgi:hypothetical protein